MSVYANEKVGDKNWMTADSALMHTGPDWARWELHWNDGAMVCCTEDSRDEAVQELARYGFSPK